MRSYIKPPSSKSFKGVLSTIWGKITLGITFALCATLFAAVLAIPIVGTIEVCKYLLG